MIIGLGTDIVYVERIKKVYEDSGEHFISKIFTVAERKDIDKLNGFERKKICKLAKLFAAKEAAVKALGTGFSDGISWQDVEITHDEKGCPKLNLSKKALEKANDLSKGEDWQILLSLSDDYPWAQAVVIIEKCC